MKKSLRNRIFSIFLFFLSLLFITLSFEVILRIIRPIQLVGISHQPLIYERDENIGFRYAAGARGWIRRNFEMNNHVLINSDCFHDIERTFEMGTDNIRIVAIGDSFTASLHVPTKDTWTQITEQELRKRLNLSCQVINRGLDSTGTDVHLSILSSYLRTNKAHAVILAFYENDVRNVGRKKVYREVYDEYVINYQNDSQRDQIVRHIQKKKPSGVTRALYNGSYLFRAVSNVIGKASFLQSNFIRPSDAGIKLSRHDKAETKIRVRKLLLELAAISEKAGVVLYVIPVPTKEDLSLSYRVLKTVTTPNLLPRLKIIDVAPVIRKLLEESDLDYSQLFWKYDGHLNAKGNLFFGVAVAILLARDQRFLSKASHRADAGDIR